MVAQGKLDHVAIDDAGNEGHEAGLLIQKSFDAVRVLVVLENGGVDMKVVELLCG